MSRFLRFVAIFILAVVSVEAQYYVPDVLGEPFEQHTFDMGSDYGGEVVSTLVRATPVVEGQRGVLYIHGYSDYFYQEKMARRFVDSGYNFYAVDLRRYGRSIRPGQTPYDVRDLSEYFADIDSALVVMQREGSTEIVLVAHSTGGLISSLYCMQPDSLRQPIEVMILNSPFLDMNMPKAMEQLVVPAVSLFGRLAPSVEVPQDGVSVYSQSLHRDFHGEWDFNLNWKPINSQPLTTGWLNAIHQGHKRVQRSGADIALPILLLYSDKSIVATEWSEAVGSADAVLDVVDIKRYGARLGSQVTHAEIPDAIHDVVLSRPDVREVVYQRIFEWLDQL